MSRSARLLLAAVGAAAAMGFATSGANAVTFEAEPVLLWTSTGTATFEASGISISCPLTLSANLASSQIFIEPGNAFASVIGMEIGSCTGGAISGVLGTPWSVTIVDTLPTFSRFTNTNATGMLLSLNGISFNLSVFGGFVNCLYRGNAGLLMAMTATSRGGSGYTARTLRMLEAVSIPLSRGGFGCPSSGGFRGSFTLRITQTITLRP